MGGTGEESEPMIEGSGAGLIAFLNWAIDKNELVETTASALRTGCIKVLSVEDDWQSLDLRTANLDDIIRRFKTKHRMDMKDRTVEQYEQRFRQSVDMYLKRLNGEPWQPAQRQRKTSSPQAGNGSTAKPNAATSRAAAHARHAVRAGDDPLSVPHPARHAGQDHAPRGPHHP